MPIARTDRSVSVYPSSSKVRCGHPGCSFHGLKRNLKKHMERFHKGQAIQLQNTGFGVGGKWQSWIQTSGKNKINQYLSSE